MKTLDFQCVVAQLLHHLTFAFVFGFRVVGLGPGEISDFDIRILPQPAFRVVVEFNCLLFLRPFSPSITVNLRNNNMLYH